MSAADGPKVLFVDDDPNILDSFRRTYRNHLRMDTVDSGPGALLQLRLGGPYAVIVSDQRMPQMSGIQLLKQVATAFPDTVRIMLTGNADQQTAIDAVNSGHIYRFLTKPCPPAAILNAVQDGIRVWERRQTEHELLEGTLSGAVSLLTEILEQLHPESRGQSHRLRQMVRHVAETLHLEGAWQYELAASLLQIGCAVLDPDLLGRVNAGLPMSVDQLALYRSHPKVGASLIRNLPRLGLVADMISRQLDDIGEGMIRPLEELEPAVVGGHLLRIVLAIDLAMRRGQPFKEAVQQLQETRRDLRPDMLHALQLLQMEAATLEVRPVKLKDLRVGMTLADDVRTSNDILLTSKGQIMTDMMLERFRAFAESVGIQEPMLVHVSTYTEAGEEQGS